MKIIEIKSSSSKVLVAISRKEVSGVGITQYGIEKNDKFIKIFNGFKEANPIFKEIYVQELFVSEGDSEARWVKYLATIAPWPGIEVYSSIPKEITKRLFVQIPEN